MEQLLKILEGFDEVQLLELLEINSSELIERFRDKIEDRIDDLMEKLECV